jgi:hypothetical protein
LMSCTRDDFRIVPDSSLGLICQRFRFEPRYVQDAGLGETVYTI